MPMTGHDSPVMWWRSCLLVGSGKRRQVPVKEAPALMKRCSAAYAHFGGCLTFNGMPSTPEATAQLYNRVTKLEQLGELTQLMEAFRSCKAESEERDERQVNPIETFVASCEDSGSFEFLPRYQNGEALTRHLEAAAKDAARRIAEISQRKTQMLEECSKLVLALKLPNPEEYMEEVQNHIGSKVSSATVENLSQVVLQLNAWVETESLEKKAQKMKKDHALALRDVSDQAQKVDMKAKFSIELKPMESRIKEIEDKYGIDPKKRAALAAAEDTKKAPAESGHKFLRRGEGTSRRHSVFAKTPTQFVGMGTASSGMDKIK
ncbi:hypothetical protein CYMTET_4001 [Cymbomonas tetramitiformis]|uniref:Uncharacterized protein n=1 Tax=Cymbomonas tetramitiformis TaxID=36881 RepID=A0AAE0H2H1_9CHLO|nr:hypothetical protein CYMTET_4001 [Cymbomonas tetramitiformis]